MAFLHGNVMALSKKCPTLVRLCELCVLNVLYVTMLSVPKRWHQQPKESIDYRNSLKTKRAVVAKPVPRAVVLNDTFTVTPLRHTS